MVSALDVPSFPADVPTVDLPIIDFDLLRKYDRIESGRVLQACQGLGFFLLKNHRIDAEFMFDLANMTFGLPHEEKMVYAMAPGQYFGYKHAGVHIVDDKGTPDVFETYHISRDDVLRTDPRATPLDHPEPINLHRPELEKFVHSSHSVADVICRILSTELGLDPEALPSRHNIDIPSGSHARITHAPPVSSDTICLGEHSDFGSITILFNRLGGLQVLLPGTRIWKYIRPVPGTACINLGDAMVKFTGGRLVSGVHRVVGPPGEQAKCPRHSVVYFSRPNGNEKLGDLSKHPSEWGEESLTADQWIERRVRGLAKEDFKSAQQWHEQRGTEHHQNLGMQVQIQHTDVRDVEEQ